MSFPVAHLRSALSSRGDLEAALLLGSLAEGRERPDSDVDLAVSMGRPLTAEERMRLTEQVARISSRPVYLVDLETAHGLILKHALVRGTPLVPPRPATLERLLKRMIYEQADLAPQVRQAKLDRVSAFIHGF